MSEVILNMATSRYSVMQICDTAISRIKIARKKKFEKFVQEYLDKHRNKKWWQFWLDKDIPYEVAKHRFLQSEKNLDDYLDLAWRALDSATTISAMTKDFNVFSISVPSNIWNQILAWDQNGTV